jgi:hypothetical protein
MLKLDPLGFRLMLIAEILELERHLGYEPTGIRFDELYEMFTKDLIRKNLQVQDTVASFLHHKTLGR